MLHLYSSFTILIMSCLQKRKSPVVLSIQQAQIAVVLDEHFVAPACCLFNQGPFTDRKIAKSIEQFSLFWFIFQEQKRLQEQFIAEQEALYGSRSANKKPLGLSTSANTMVGTPTARRGANPFSQHANSTGKQRRESRAHNVTPVNYVALSKEDSVSRGC